MSDLSHAHSPIEHAVENLCSHLLKKSAEFWEERNKAVLELTRIVLKFQGASPETLHEVFNINVFRALIEPVKQMVLDLRSQQVRDTCIFLTHLSKITGDLMRFFLRDTFESIFIAVKVPNKVMSGYVDECIISMLQNTTFKSAIPVIIGEYRESKSKAAREKCLVYLNTILTCWDLIDKEGDQIDDVIRLGLEDASMKGRELAREAFISFRRIFPEKAERLKASLSSSVLSRLIKAEKKHESKMKQLQLQKEGELHQQVSPVPRTASDDDLDHIMSKSTPSGRRRDGEQENAVTSIQALIRGNMARRGGPIDRLSILEDHRGHNSSSEYLDDNMEPIVVNASRGNTEFHDNNVAQVPRYHHKAPVTPVDTLSPHTTTWFDADQISPLTMENGRHSHDNLRGLHDESRLASQRKTMSPTQSPPLPTKPSKTPSLSLDGHTKHVRDICDIQLGMVVVLKDRTSLQGVVKFLGQTSFASGVWVGIELNVPLGKNNGCVQGFQYFECPPLHGLFVRPQHLLIVVSPDADPVLSAEKSKAMVVAKTEPRESPSRTSAETLRATLNIAHALKVKISKEMHMLNHQLEMVESFELQVQGTEGVNQDHCSRFVTSLVDVVYAEEHLCKEFGTLIHGQQQQM